MPNLASPAEELESFCRRHGAGPWVVDELGANMRLEQWVVDFIDKVRTAATESADADAERLEKLREILDAKPGQKIIAVKRVREAIQ